MRTVILDGTEVESPIKNILKRMLEERSGELSYFKLKDMNIRPCRSCGACGHKSPGKCVIADDMPEILRAFAFSSMVVLVTPVRFGGYSSQLKKAIDRFMVVGTPFYEVKKGHLLHPMRYGDKALVAIGLVEEEVQGQEEAFSTLVDHNALNMQLSYNRALVFKPSDTEMDIENEIGKVLREVNAR